MQEGLRPDEGPELGQIEPTQQDHVDSLPVAQLLHNGQRGSHDRQIAGGQQVASDVAGDLQRRRAAVKDELVTGLDQLGSRPANAFLFLDVPLNLGCVGLVQSRVWNRHRAAVDALEEAATVKERPSIVVANTIKGKGVSFMEDRYQWHAQVPNDEELKLALEELNKLAREELAHGHIED